MRPTPHAPSRSPAAGRTARVGLWTAVLVLFAAAGCRLSPDPFTPFVHEDAALTRLAGDDSPVAFLVVGDWGRRGHPVQRAVAEQMGRVAAQVGADFVVTVGDNFYDHGVRGVEDRHWEQSFERVYTHAALQVPWYPTLGNHDHHGDVEAQVAYSAHSERWRMPARYYTRRVWVDDTTAADLFFLDTLPLYRLQYRAIRGQGTAHRAAAERQLRWLDSTLAASTAAWKLVVGHHPLYSAGDHGDAEVLVRELMPILERHGVQAYFAGHEHNLQHLEAGGLDLFVSGAGSHLRRTRPHPLKVFATARPGFVVATLAPRRMIVQLVDAAGNVLHGEVIDLAASGDSSLARTHEPPGR